jgi:cytochrome c-type biogenesis protein CcmE
MNPRRSVLTRGRRTGIIVTILIIISGLGYLALGNFGKNLVYFFTPSEVAAFSHDYYGKKVRVGGMVVEGSVKVIPNTLKMTFDLTDGTATIPVAFQGIPPDLFKEGQGAVVEGYWNQEKQFHSNLIMAKHSEDYMPIELKQAGIKLPKKDLLKTLQ